MPWNGTKTASLGGSCGRRQLRPARDVAREYERRFYDCRIGGTSCFASCQATVLASSALSVLVPILEDIVGWPRLEIRDFFERSGFLIQEWESVRTDWLTLRPSNEAATLKPTISEAKKADAAEAG